MDIIKSTDSPQTNDMKIVVNQVFKCFDNIYYEVTGNDAFLICATEPTVLLDIARVIMLEGERLMIKGVPFGGTRKALSFGRVKVVQRTDGNCVIMDECTPNIIPAAFSVLDAIDQTEHPDKNALVAIAGVNLGAFEEVLAPLESDRKMVRIFSKHYAGSCWVYDLSAERKAAQA